MCMRACARVACSVFYIQNKLYRFETQIRREVLSRKLSKKLRRGISSCTIKWEIVIHVYRDCSSSP